MAAILRGDIFWADLNPARRHEQSGMRPVVVISHDVFNERSGTVIALAIMVGDCPTITSQPQQAGFPLTLELAAIELPKVPWVKISQVRTLSTERLSGKIGRVSPETLAQLVEGFNEIIG